MHDVGKVAIADAILLKPGKLTKEEFEEMKKHAEYGYDIFKNSKRNILKTAATIAYEHHERWDGSGYPRGIRGEEIHLYGRITAVADVFDALSCDRVYKEAWNDEEIEKYFKEHRGTQFEPKLVDLFFENLKALQAIRYRFTKQSVVQIV
jgi:response regulator RpfG family c-di-GMP phosphodiesterase